jgi:hypothetical protein
VYSRGKLNIRMEKIDSRVSSIEVSDAEPPVADQFKLSDRHIAVKCSYD